MNSSVESQHQGYLLAFSSERFDYRSKLPASYNAGNRLYGQDVACYLAEQLGAAGLKADAFEEDWGWLVECSLSADQCFQVGVYNLTQQASEGGEAGTQWGLCVQAFQRKKRWKVFSRWVSMPVTAQMKQAVGAAVQALGQEPDAWPEVVELAP